MCGIIIAIGESASIALYLIWAVVCNWNLQNARFNVVW